MTSKVTAIRIVEEVKEEIPFKCETSDTRNEPKTIATGLIDWQ